MPVPMVDMPYEALLSYQGTNPCPADFDTFWDRRVREADGRPAQARITPSGIQGFHTVDCMDLWFDGIDGVPIYAKYVRPRIGGDLPLALQFHGYPGAARSFLTQMELAGMGMAVLAMNCPGQGGRSAGRSADAGTTVAGHIVMGLNGPTEEMYYVRIFQDAYRLSRLAATLPGVDGGRLYCVGQSQGAALSLVTASLNPEIRRCAVSYPFLSDYKRVWEMGVFSAAYEGVDYYTKWLDPLAKGGLWEKLGYIDVQNFVHRMRAEVLFASGLSDTVCPPSTHFAVYNKIPSPKALRVYPDYGHEELPDFDDLLLDFLAEGGGIS